MKSFKQFSEQAVAAAAPAPTPKFSAKAQPKPKVSDPSTGVDIDAQGRWQGQIVDTGQELEPGYEEKVKDGKSGPDPDMPAGIAALIGSVGVTMKQANKALWSTIEKELIKAGVDPKQAKSQAKNYQMEFDRMKKGNDKQLVVTDKTTNKPVQNPNSPSHGYLKAGGGVRGKGLSPSVIRDIGKVGKAVADIVLTSIGIGGVGKGK